MSPVTTVSQVFDSLQKVKAGASDFCTNFFPVQAKVQSWIDHHELFAEERPGVAFFERKDRDFGHLYFSAGETALLARELPSIPGSAGVSPASEIGILSTDVIGQESGLAPLLSAFESSGFRRHSKLFRLSRKAAVSANTADLNPEVAFATLSDAPAILALLESSFDKYADQIPLLYELEEALAARQIILLRRDGQIAALVHFETQGFTSTVRYWVVAEAFRSQRFGAQLLRHYFAMHPGVRRFVLWVAAANENAVQKYAHYGYAPDGLIDHVLLK
ncbi:MAG TPA: GNAT family N-acetyltransferase [Candidatus Dormibacteraeota bacterium]|nr:GNAT family N-acetyltransferase [Candidatus Dormibacteraeota bacterium]